MEFKKKKDLPIYEIVISDDSDLTEGINLISLVDNPAIEKMGVAFSKEDEFKSFKYYDRPEVHPNCKCRIENDKWILDANACAHCIKKKEKFDRATQRKKERNKRKSDRKKKGSSSQPSSSSFSFSKLKDEQIIIGEIMVPEKLIYRRDEKKGEYYVKFSAESIKKLVYKFNKNRGNRVINLEHSDVILDAYIAEIWTVESEVYDKSRLYNLNATVGGVVTMVKVDDVEVWEEQVKKLGKQGFSIEGILSHQLIEMVLQESDIDNYIEQQNAEDNNTIEDFSTIIEHLSIEDIQECMKQSE